MSMLTDFSPRRPELWPTLARELYCVHKIITTSAPDAGEKSLAHTDLGTRPLRLVCGRSGALDRPREQYSKPGSYVQAIVHEAQSGVAG